MAALVLGPGLVATAHALASEPDLILVTSAGDVVNGDVSRVARLRARPGPDGVSLREAVEATNNDPGRYAIRFDRTLVGRELVLGSRLPALTGGAVDLDGDIDGDGSPDVAIRPEDDGAVGIHVSSSANRIANLIVEGFEAGVVIGLPPEPPVIGQTFSDNTLSGLVMRDVFDGIDVAHAHADCASPCATLARWLNTTIIGNDIEAEEHGIMFFVAGDRDQIVGATVTDNSIRITGPALGPGINAETAGDSTGAQISDVLIARNEIDGSPDIGIQIGAGGNRGQGGLLERVEVIDNHLVLAQQAGGFCCVGIAVEAGSDSAEMAIGPPVRYLDDNVVRDVTLRGNTIEGDVPRAIEVHAGNGGGGSRNRIERLVIEANTVRSTLAGLGTGTLLIMGEGPPYGDRYAEDNRISDVTIRRNEFTIASGCADSMEGRRCVASGIGLLGGHEFGRTNVIRDVDIEDNVVEHAHVGIIVIGGIGPTASGNVVEAVRIGDNQLVGVAERVAVIDNLRGASGNTASAAVAPGPSAEATATLPAPTMSSPSTSPSPVSSSTLPRATPQATSPAAPSGPPSATDLTLPAVVAGLVVLSALVIGAALRRRG